MKNNRLITLSNHSVEVGILPDLGGRVVVLRKPGFDNILKSDQNSYEKHSPERQTFTGLTRWRAYGGHIVWLGPQSTWWTQQNVFPPKCRNKAVWPPDPYLSYARYTIQSCDSRSIVMEGPSSRFSGVALTKSISIDAKGKVLFTVCAKNTGTKKVSWDLWLNTRVDGYARCYVPISNPADIRIPVNQEYDTMSHVIACNRYFTFIPRKPSSGMQSRSAKAFIYPEKPFIAAFDKSQCLIVRFAKHPLKSIHPEQGLVEIFNNTTPIKSNSLMELEYHSPYKELSPGESMKTSETWELFPYSGPASSADHIDFIEKIKS